MKTEHTPLPWELVPQNGAGPMIAHRFETGNQMNPTGLRLIAHAMERGNSLAQDRANAALIVRAVNSYADMLAALEECEEYLDSQSDVVDGSYGEPAPNKAMSLLVEVRAAIRRAKGEG